MIAWKETELTDETSGWYHHVHNKVRSLSSTRKESTIDHDYTTTTTTTIIIIIIIIISSSVRTAALSVAFVAQDTARLLGRATSMYFIILSEEEQIGCLYPPQDECTSNNTTS